MFSKECPAWESCWLARDLHWPGFDWSKSPSKVLLLDKLAYKHKPYKDMITNCRGNKPSNKLKVKQQTSTYGDTKSYCYNDPPPSLPWWQQAFYGHIPISGLYQGQWTLWKLGSSQTQRMPTDDKVNTFIFGHIRQIFSGQLNKNIVRNSIPVP